eukprot:1184052-Prorocentrum_minimum.AAC.7
MSETSDQLAELVAIIGGTLTRAVRQSGSVCASYLLSFDVNSPPLPVISTPLPVISPPLPVTSLPLPVNSPHRTYP